MKTVQRWRNNTFETPWRTRLIITTSIASIELDKSIDAMMERLSTSYLDLLYKWYQQVVVKFQGFIPRTKVYKARKHKSDISVQLDLTKRRYDLLKEACTRIKGADSVEYAFANINCSFGLHLKNGRFKCFNSSEELDMALAEVWLCLSFFFICFHVNN